MRRLPPSFDASVSAFRDDDRGSLVEGAATRARVLVRAEREARRRDAGAPDRRAASAIALAILLSGAALTAAGCAGGRRAAAQIDDVPEGAPLGHRG